MEKVKISKIYINDTNKAGKPFIDKNGKPFKKVAIKTDAFPDRWASSLAFKPDDPKLALKEGDEVYLKLWETEDGGFLNFDLPSRADLLEERIAKLEKMVFGQKAEDEAEAFVSEEDDRPF